MSAPIIKNDQNTAAIVVTFNRAKLLNECLTALLKQGSSLKQIYVVNNASTDETLDVLDIITSQHPNLITIINLPTNVGGAGGFHEGVKSAFNDGYSWFWLMDDDVEPYENSLNNLLKYRNYSKCIHGKRTSPDGSTHYWEAKFNSKYGFAVPCSDRSFKEGKKYCSVNVGCFEGMLIHKDVVDKIGFPDSRFFISWDDTIYGFLASKHTDVIYVDEFSLKRKRDLKYINLGFRKLTVTSDLYRYYHTRNRALVKSYVSKEPEFNNFLFNLTSLAFAIKEFIRAITLEGDLTAIKPILIGTKRSFSKKDFLAPYFK